MKKLFEKIQRKFTTMHFYFFLSVYNPEMNIEKSTRVQYNENFTKPIEYTWLVSLLLQDIYTCIHICKGCLDHLYVMILCQGQFQGHLEKSLDLHSVW